jgi:hypothetical protein
MTNDEFVKLLQAKLLSDMVIQLNRKYFQSFKLQMRCSWASQQSDHNRQLPLLERRALPAIGSAPHRSGGSPYFRTYFAYSYIAVTILVGCGMAIPLWDTSCSCRYMHVYLLIMINCKSAA